MTEKNMKIRIDLALVQSGLARDIKHAQALVLSGVVVVDEQRVDKCGALILTTGNIRLKNRSRWVSRAGEKLHALVEAQNLGDLLKGATVLDIGASTGGFTDCALFYGAKKVLALDVGVTQLHWSLVSDSRVCDLQGVDIRKFDVDQYPRVDVVLADISFNSLSRLAPAIMKVGENRPVTYIFLVKPQFELKQTEVESGGVVTSGRLRMLAVDRVLNVFEQYGLRNPVIFESPVKGRSGNQEIFLTYPKAIVGMDRS